MASPAQWLHRMLDELAGVSDERGALTRTYLSPAMGRATKLVARWMRAAGLQVREDVAGNVIGRLEGALPRTRTLLLGSHLDTVRDAGRFDGPLGVLLPLAALAELQRRGVRLPYAVEVLGFAEEEGVRFASAYLGSKGYTGQLRAADLKLTDARGTTVGSLLTARAGRRLALPTAAHRPDELHGYVEVHIEQGPVLENRGLAVGVVTAIAGQSRFKLTWTGRAGHAGTTPMDLRRDALAGAAEFIMAAEALGRARAGLVATVGAIRAAPGAANVIAGEATHTLDVRHADDRVRQAALRRLRARAAAIARRRGILCTWQATQDNGAVRCAKDLTALLGRSVKTVQGRSVALVSGAGHDAVVLSALAPVAMLFVRCREGLSHHPDEYAAPQDIDVALRVTVDFLLRLAKEGRHEL